MSNAKAVPAPKKVAVAKKEERERTDIRRIIRLMSRFLVGERKQFVLAAILLVIENATALLPTLIVGIFVGKYLTPRVSQLIGFDVPQPLSPLQSFGLPSIINPDIDTVAIVTIGIVLLTMINSLADSLAEICLARGGRMLGTNLRIALYDHLQKLSLAFYSKQRTGDLLTRVTSDVTALEEFVVKSLSDIVGSVLAITFTLYLMVANAWQVAVVAVLIIPVMAIVSNYFSQKIKAASKKQRSREGDLAASAQEMLTSIRVVQTYGSGSSQQKRFTDQSRKTMESALEAAAIQARFSWVVSVLESAATALIICLVVWLIWQSIGIVSPTESLAQIALLAVFTKYITDMFKPTKKIIKEWNTVGKIYASVERIGDILDRAPAVVDAPNAAVAPHFQGEVAFNHVSFAYMPEPEDVKEGQIAQPKLALSNVSFTIAPGEVVALVGGSGAGKSTIVQLLPRLYDPHAGSITIDGADIRSFTLDSLRSRMSMVLQEAILFTGTVANNIAYGKQDATREQIIAAAMQANAHDFIEQMPQGYDTDLSERASNLSGGQRQRIAIARAFIRNTPVLILDEPTTGLDAESTELVLLALHELMKGKATIIISHDLNLIRQADKIIAIKSGQIEEVGTHKELLRQGGLYADLYQRQFGFAMDERSAPAPVAPALIETITADDDDEDDLPSVTPRAFQTLIGKALPVPVTPKAFQTLMMQVVPPPPPAAQPIAAAQVARPAAGPTPAPAPVPQAVKPVPTPVPAPVPQAVKPVSTPVPQAVKPVPTPAPAPVPQAVKPVSTPAPQAVKPVPTPAPAPVPQVVKPVSTPAPQAIKPMPLPAASEHGTKPKPAIFETTVMHTIPEPATDRTEIQLGLPREQHHANASSAARTANAGSIDHNMALLRDAAPPLDNSIPEPLDTLGHTGLRGERLDLLNSAVLQNELPALKVAFDAAIMREQIQSVLFGKARPNYSVESCEVDQATYLPGEGVAIRYEVVVKDRLSPERLEPLVVAMVFPNQLACALYMRDKLAPLVELTRGRPDLAPFATPAAMIEPLNMALHVFPIDGELPALVPATNPQRMREIFNETLPAALGNSLDVETCAVELVDYARRYRAVLRYQLAGHRPGSSRVEQQTVYGKVFTSNIGALAGPVTAALRERVLGSPYKFNVPRSLGWRPDMQLSLLEAIPGKPLISDLLKARLRNKPVMPGTLSLEEMVDVCANVAATLHSSEIRLGRRRTLDDELAMLRKNFAEMRRLTPELGAQMEKWLEQLSTYAEQSDALGMGFCHGDFTYTQLVFEGAEAGLVDFDSICQAEPALDLGHFLAYLRVAGLKAEKLADGAPNTLVEQLSERFMTTYLAAMGDRVEEVGRLRVRVAIYQMISLLRRALRSWQKFKGSRLENALVVIEEEMACLPLLDY